MLEIASGTGEHACYFAASLPQITWQPSDMDAAAIASVEAYRQDAELTNLASAIHLDVTAETWPITQADAMLCVNMIHISPWFCCEHLMRGAAQILSSGNPLVLYGPFKKGGQHTAPSNAMFDESLRQQNPDWGVRDIADVESAGAAVGLRLDPLIPMPSNNFCAVFRQA